MYGLTSDGFLKRLLKGIRLGFEIGTGADAGLQEPDCQRVEARHDDTDEDPIGDSSESHDENRTHGKTGSAEPVPQLVGDVELIGGK
jgi:hypothetical protein